MQRLTIQQITQLVLAVTQAGISRKALLSSFSPAVVATLPIDFPSLEAQLIAELNHINRLQPNNGVDPLRDWLQTASTLSTGRIQQQVFDNTLLILSAPSKKTEKKVSLLETKLIEDRLLFLDRDSVRSQLERMESAPTTLILRGPAQCGKTRVAELVDSYAQATGAHRIWVYDLSTSRPQEIAQELIHLISPEPGKLSDPPKATEVAILLRKWLTEQRKPCWFIIDDIIIDDTDEQVSANWELLSGVIHQLSRGSGKEYCRFLLINPPNPPSGLPSTVFDTITLSSTELRPELLDEFIGWLFTERLRLEATPEAQATLRQRIQPELPTNDPAWIAQLSERVREHIPTFLWELKKT